MNENEQPLGAPPEEIPNNEDANATTTQALDGVTEAQEELKRKQFEEAKATAMANFKEYLAKLDVDLTEKVKSGQLPQEVKDTVMRSEELRMDEDFLSRRGVVQITYESYFRFVQTCFEFNELMNGAKVKTMAMDHSPMQGTIDVLICHEKLQPLKEGEIPPVIRMPEIPFNDMRTLLAIRKRDADIMQATLRGIGWNVTIRDNTKAKIIVPGSG